MLRLRSLLCSALCLLLPTRCSIVVDLSGLSSEAGGAGAGGDGGAGGGIGVEDISFTDDERAEFDEGTYAGTAWAGDRVALAPGEPSGDFTSRVFDAEQVRTQWKTVSWRPTAPYGKALPDAQAAETGYPEGAIDMKENVLLLHLDGAGAIAPGQVFEDASGRGNSAVATSSDGSSFAFVDGRLESAIGDTAAGYIYVDLGAHDDFNFGAVDFTWAIWVRTTESCVGNKVHLGVEDVGVDRAHLWLGCKDSAESTSCPLGETGGRAGGTFRSQHNAVDGGTFCGSSVINDGRWHHLAIVKAGHPAATLRLYVDGLIEHTVSATFVAPIELFDAPQLAIGAFSEGTYQAVGDFDEAAIWRRALSAAEMSALYRRGAFRLGFQVQTCLDAACAGGGGFVGPGGDATAWFREPAGALEPGAALALPGLPKARYLQYKTRLESDVAEAGPGLTEVTITAVR